MLPELIGYADKLSVAPGERIRFMVSTDMPTYDVTIVRLIHGDKNPQGPGYKEQPVATSANRTYNGRKQKAYVGAYVAVRNAPALAELDSFTIQAWIYPTTPLKGQRQGLITKWSAVNESGYGLFIGAQGDLGLMLGDGSGKVDIVQTGVPLRARQWYFVAATYDKATHKVQIHQLTKTNFPLEKTSTTIERGVSIQGSIRNDSPLLMAATYGGVVGKGNIVGVDLYNGKIDNPNIFSRVLSPAELERLKQDVPPQEVAKANLVAAWDFSADISTSKVTDRGRHHLHGVCVNMPVRAVTGHNWKYTEVDFRHVPNEYAAIHFHDDEFEDARWEADFELDVPEGLKSGYYAARLRSGDYEDHIPFFIRPRKGTASASILYLAPTNTYQAYANQQQILDPAYTVAIHDRELALDPLDHYLAEHPEFGKSLYDLHTDGSGVCYSSRLRPIVTSRPKYLPWLEGAPRHLGGDLYLIDWLEQKGFAYDVATEEDLHFDGKELLSRYKVIISGMHPEYWSYQMLDAVSGYLVDGGKMMYLGGNGYYWVTSFDPERPHIIEVRKGFAGSRNWTSQAGEYYHSSTGEFGGIWRHRGRTPNLLVGAGFAAMGWTGTAPGYTRKADSFDPRAAFIFEGIGKEEIIGNFGLVLGGAAGDEIDRMDYALGTPPHALQLASSSNHSEFILPVIEDYNQIDPAFMINERPNVRADLVYFETPNNGAVFTAGAITWCGSLSHNNYDNNVSRITENVLRKFSA